MAIYLKLEFVQPRDTMSGAQFRGVHNSEIGVRVTEPGVYMSAIINGYKWYGRVDPSEVQALVDRIDDCLDSPEWVYEADLHGGARKWFADSTRSLAEAAAKYMSDAVDRLTTAKAALDKHGRGRQ